MNRAEPNREALTAWVKEQHAGQLIRKTDKPYFDHLLFVAEKAGSIFPLGYEIGICHDLLEDTGMPADELYDMLLQFGYTDTHAKFITDAVLELTDIFTALAYPEMSKKERKMKEDERLSGISSTAQTVKYADLIYNIDWTLKYEPRKANKYLEKEKKLLGKLTDGDECLRRRVQDVLLDGLDQMQVARKLCNNIFR